MRVFMLTDDFPPKGDGGMARSVDALCYGLNAAGIVLKVITWKPNVGSVSEYRDRYDVIRVSRAMPIETDLSRDLEVNCNDIIHVNGRGFADLAMSMKTRGASLIYTSRSNCKQHTRLGVRAFNHERLRKQDILMKCSDLVVACSKAEAHLLSSDYPEYSKKINACWNPIHPHFLTMANMRDRHINPDGPRVLYMGRFRQHKGLTQLLDCMDLVLLANPSISFECVGGHDHDDDLELVQAICRFKQRWADRVVVREWQYSLEDISDCYSRADIVVVPSSYEPFGQVAIEAMVHSCAVVASSVGGLQELINESGGGTLVNASDIPGMASTILGLIANVELCREMGQSGTAWVRSCLRPE